MLALNGWRLALLFVVSGYATAALLARSERLAFLRSRSARLLIPTRFAIIVVIPPQVWIALMYNHGYAQPFAAFWRTDYFRFGTLEGIVMPTWQHLWFVVYLFAYTLVILALHALLPAQARCWIVKLLGKVFASAGGLLAIPVLWAVLRPLFIFPGVEDTHALLDDFAAHYIFLAAFLFGFLLRHSAPLWSAIRVTWHLAGLIALVATAAMVGQVWWLTGHEWSDGAAAIYAVVRGVQSWCTIVALLGVADRFWNRDARCRTMLNEAVFPFYIIHQTIIVMFIWYLRPVAMPAGAAFLLTVAITAIGCWLFYRIGRAVPGLRLLIGLRGWRIPPSTAPMDAAFRRV
jgi:hypothetical protein